MSISALSTALCLPALDIEALLQGRTIAAISSTFRNPSRFLLLPIDISLSIDQLSAKYQSQFLHSFKATNTKIEDSDTVAVYAWAKCKTCRIFGKGDNLAALSALTAWTPFYLEERVQEQHKVFVLFLQVYRFVDPLKLRMPRLKTDRISTYVQVPGAWSDQGAMSILDDETFAARQKQLIRLTPPSHPELQALQRALVFEREYSLGAMALDRDIRYLLGWSRPEETHLYDSDLSWIQQITTIGNSDDALEFQEVARRCFIKLGFCEQQEDEDAFMNLAEDAATLLRYRTPYTVLAACKPGKDNIASQHFLESLLLEELRFKASEKVAIAAGPLTKQAQQIAKGNRINVIRPETLQKLTEMKARYPGSIDLLKLKACLQQVPFGEAADHKVDQFIAESWFQLRVRSAVIQAVKTCMERTGQESVGTDTVCSMYAVAFAATELPRLSVGEVQDILVELSSPVAGYLGRDRASNGKMLFYFLRELCVEGNGLLSAF